MDDKTALLLMGLSIGLAIGGLAGFYISGDSWEKMTIKNSCGQYNSITGNFEFLPEQSND